MNIRAIALTDKKDKSNKIGSTMQSFEYLVFLDNI